ncbi:hypothetical protein LOC68_08900 [Blastopirellula sp. JC732]|uniref:Uncharacterized protein n=1 Tax=Blastopirellula sediminis TaxID=2894196 RepID=A0A9X1SG41_9BACT|nr:hypothetical protein [Blastopirellula sediminis]MCC9608711.1 hypothetical protein [Blastopirellula sediminis]MCC9628512.1 hypothetical protein [Blastopirellula sediminis]
MIVAIVILSIWLLLPQTPLFQVSAFAQVGFVAFLFCFARINFWLKWGMLFAAISTWNLLSPNTYSCATPGDPHNHWLAKLLLMSIIANYTAVAIICVVRQAKWSWWKFSIWQLVAMVAGVAITLACYKESFLAGMDKLFLELNRPSPEWSDDYRQRYVALLIDCWAFPATSAFGFAAVGLPLCVKDRQRRSYVTAVCLGAAVWAPLLRVVANYLIGRQLDSGLADSYGMQALILGLFAMQLYGLNFALRSNGICWLYQIDEQEVR